MAKNQKEQDWVQWLWQAKWKQITQREAAERMGVTERWVRKLLARMKRAIRWLRTQALTSKICM